MICLIAATALFAVVSTVILIFCIRRLKKYCDHQIENERNYRHKLEELYVELRNEYTEHYFKYH